MEYTIYSAPRLKKVKRERKKNGFRWLKMPKDILLFVVYMLDTRAKRVLNLVDFWR